MSAKKRSNTTFILPKIPRDYMNDFERLFDENFDLKTLAKCETHVATLNRYKLRAEIYHKILYAMVVPDVRALSLPPEAKWLTMDSDGSWRTHVTKPEQAKYIWREVLPANPVCRMPVFQANTDVFEALKIDWREMLIEIPRRYKKRKPKDASAAES